MRDFKYKCDFQTRLFGHAWLIAPIDSENCVILDKTTSGFIFKHFSCKAIDLAKKLVENACEVYEVPVKRISNRVPEFFTCTGFVKKVLNIKSFWILTPKQLRRYIHGRHPVVRTTSD
jgi:hypothetical protein